MVFGKRKLLESDLSSDDHRHEYDDTVVPKTPLEIRSEEDDVAVTMLDDPHNSNMRQAPI